MTEEQISKVLNSIRKYWGTPEQYQAVINAAKSTSKLKTLNLEDLETFVSALKKEGYRIVKIPKKKTTKTRLK